MDRLRTKPREGRGGHRDLTYEELTKALEEDCRLYEEKTKRRKKPLNPQANETRREILEANRRELREIRESGGGHVISRNILGDRVFRNTDGIAMGKSTDFDYGHNEPPEKQKTIADEWDSVDQRIADEEAGRCMGKTICQDCGKYHGYSAEVTEDKEKLRMLPTGDTSGTKSTGRRGSSGSGMEYLKNDDLSTNQVEGRILGVKYDAENRFGPRVLIKLAINGHIKFWGVPTNKAKSPNYRLLLEKFGPEENDWLEKIILLSLEKDDFTGNYFPRVDFPSTKRART